MEDLQRGGLLKDIWFVHYIERERKQPLLYSILVHNLFLSK